ncbi:MAG: hypothetical protein Q8N88_03740 [Nanoarchaeota archaeon]|nr:hypothetical protein [Nanoarchaeota archaeon]
MRKEEIKDKKKVLVLILRNGEFPSGLNFYTKDKDFVQVATWKYDKSKKTSAHLHKIAKRVAKRTQEVVYIKKGKVRLNIYNKTGQKIKKIVLKQGDIAVIFEGGHSFEILENKTQALEIKNGPYPGIKKDKKIINE